MLESLDSYTGSATDRERISHAFDTAAAELKASGSHGDGRLVSRAESQVRENPGLFTFDEQGFATLKIENREFGAGRFACRSLSQLSGSLSGSGGRLQLFVIVGQSAITDIGALQAGAPPASMFQVASQFNCLESPGPSLARVADYFFDPTQGPRASISAWPATLLRHYSAPGDGGRFVQIDPSPQLNLLHKVAVAPLAEVVGGYLMANRISDPEAFATRLQERFMEIEVGVHERAEVVLGADWDGPVTGHPVISQVFTSTLAAGGYSRVDFSHSTWLLIARQLQRAAYLGTLLAAAANRQRRVVLTLIGGGVFGNPIPLIWDTVLWACSQVAPRLDTDLTVILNGRELPLDLGEVQSAARDLGGDLILCAPGQTRIGAL